MVIEDQVLNLEQVRELQELGFDVEKHSSMCWVAYTSDEEPYEKEYSLSILDEFCYESASLEPTPTMSIGDIIEVLPFKIDTHYFLSINSEFCTYSMSGDFDTIFFTREKGIMNNLFNTLVWCIKEKHILL